MKTTKKMALLAAGAATLTGGAALAHHSFNMYDNAVYTKLNATVKTYTWRNPHVMIEIVAQTQAGPREWTVEASSPNIIGRRGWTPTSIKPGDKVSFVLHPMKNGTPYALVVSAALPNGSTLHDKE